MTVRKMITFPDRGAELLVEATDGARERAAGEYLSAVLIQRHREWMRALEDLRTLGFGTVDLQLVQLFAGRGYRMAEIEDWLQNGARVDRATAQPAAVLFHILALEYEAGNKSLMKALHSEAKS